MGKTLRRRSNRPRLRKTRKRSRVSKNSDMRRANKKRKMRRANKRSKRRRNRNLSFRKVPAHMRGGVDLEPEPLDPTNRDHMAPWMDKNMFANLVNAGNGELVGKIVDFKPYYDRNPRITRDEILEDLNSETPRVQLTPSELTALNQGANPNLLVDAASAASAASAVALLQVEDSKQRTLVFIDWDDTLYPHSYITSCVNILQKSGQVLNTKDWPLTGAAGMPIDVSSKITQFNKQHAQFKPQNALACIRLLTEAKNIGTVFLVTNAERGHVASSNTQWFGDDGDSVYNWIRENDIDVVSARDEYNKDNPRNARDIDRWKNETFHKLVEGVRKKIITPRDPGMVVDDGNALNIVSIGDANYEKDAAIDAAGNNDVVVTFKFKTRPNVEDLTRQLDNTSEYLEGTDFLMSKNITIGWKETSRPEPPQERLRSYVDWIRYHCTSTPFNVDDLIPESDGETRYGSYSPLTGWTGGLMPDRGTNYPAHFQTICKIGRLFAYVNTRTEIDRINYTVRTGTGKVHVLLPGQKKTYHECSLSLYFSEEIRCDNVLDGVKEVYRDTWLELVDTTQNIRIIIQKPSICKGTGLYGGSSRILPGKGKGGSGTFDNVMISYHGTITTGQTITIYNIKNVLTGRELLSPIITGTRAPPHVHYDISMDRGETHDLRTDELYGKFAYEMNHLCDMVRYAQLGYTDSLRNLMADTEADRLLRYLESLDGYYEYNGYANITSDLNEAANLASRPPRDPRNNIKVITLPYSQLETMQRTSSMGGGYGKVYLLDGNRHRRPDVGWTSEELKTLGWTFTEDSSRTWIQEGSEGAIKKETGYVIKVLKNKTARDLPARFIQTGQVRGQIQETDLNDSQRLRLKTLLLDDIRRELALGLTLLGSTKVIKDLSRQTLCFMDYISPVTSVYLCSDKPIPPILGSFYAGNSLDSVIRHGRLQDFFMINVALGISRGIEIIHGLGWMHRDIKPDNICISSSLERISRSGDPEAGLDYATQVKLIDFGSAKKYEPTLRNTTYGTRGFNAPEVEGNPNTADQAIDIYSYSKTLFEMTTRISAQKQSAEDLQTLEIRLVVSDGGLKTIFAQLIRDCGASSERRLRADRISHILNEKRTSLFPP